MTTITEAILAHGGEARAERDAFVALSFDEQAAIVKFLKTLQVLPSDCQALVVSEDDPCITGILPGVTLASFDATPADDHILLEWQTSSEVATRGFNIWRSSEPLEMGEQLNGELILSQAASDGQGESYQWQDHNVEEGVTYYYFLECLVSNGTTSTIATQPTAIQLSTLGPPNVGGKGGRRNPACSAGQPHRLRVVSQSSMKQSPSTEDRRLGVFRLEARALNV